MRIVSLLPAATETVALLGREDALVGVTHECDWPPSVRTLGRVTRSAIDGTMAPGVVDRVVREARARGEALFELDAARIRELAPDVILTQAVCDVCAVSDTDVRAIAASMDRSPVVVTLSGTSLEGVLRDIALVAEAIGVPDEGARAAAMLRGRMRAVRERVGPAARPRVAVIEWTDPLYTAGHWTPEIVDHAGGEDVVARAGEHSRRIEAEEIRRAEPDVLVFAPCGYDVARAASEGERLLAEDGWEWARARRVWAVDAGALVSRPGPRLVEGIETFAALLHPSLFPPPRAARALELQGALTAS